MLWLQVASILLFTLTIHTHDTDNRVLIILHTSRDYYSGTHYYQPPFSKNVDNNDYHITSQVRFNPRSRGKTVISPQLYHQATTAG